MEQITDKMLKAIMPHAPARVRAAALPILNYVAWHYDIRTERRLAAWLATIAVESGELRYQAEIASGAAYEGRRDLGNTQPGDGRRFKGRGRIQGTGRIFYTKYTTHLAEAEHLPWVDMVMEPHKLAEEPYATDAAGWFVNGMKDLNPLADANKFLSYSIRVNGRNRRTGLPNHWTERQRYYARALAAIPDGFLLDEPEALFVTEEAKAAAESEDEYPDYPLPVEDVPEASVSTPETPDVGLPASEAKTGSSGLQTPGNATQTTGSTSSLSPEAVAESKPSAFSRWTAAIKVAIGAAIASTTAWCGGNEAATILANKGAERAVENAGRDDVSTLLWVGLYIVVGLVAGTLLIWIASIFYDRSAERAQARTQKLIEAAADDNSHTVRLK